MSKYRRKVLEVEAVQFTPPMDFSFLGDNVGLNVCLYTHPWFYRIEYLNGDKISISTGDYLVKDVEGHWYPCKQSVFEKIYEPITEGEKDGLRKYDNKTS